MALRCLLFLAIVTGLAGMHVFAVDGAAGCRPVPMLGMISPSAPASTTERAATAIAQVTSALPAGPSEMAPAMERCAVFLAAGLALLIALTAQSAARALRPSATLPIHRARAVLALAPRRGPPLQRWPRIALCVIRI
jgi:hypothetical protein